MSFLYSILLKLLYPTSIAILLLLASAVFRRRARMAQTAVGSPPQVSGPILPRLEVCSSLRAPRSELLAALCFWSALAVLLLCGNGWLVGVLTRHLERQYPPLAEAMDHGANTLERPSEVSDQASVVGVATPDSRPPLNPQDSGPTPHPSVRADCILVLGGGTWPKLPPRTTVEVAEAGDRVLYATHLFRTGWAPKILCTSGIATGGIGLQPGSDIMAELLTNLGVPRDAIVQESASRNTREHAVNLESMLKEQGFHRILLVTSALHMPRSMGVFRKNCPTIEFVPAPTDFRIVDRELPWHRELVNLIPTPSSYLQFSETMHEYLGMAWYKLRGWM
ncbi:MAG TPA: YdcF family protein [Candidatus Paceibacterota bacterium]|nr:YdcF family protein [Candidatus Paceibacterota bacterium]HRT56171.1 YdcF family protein [Candidatus Paceibacterota bacterium]